MHPLTEKNKYFRGVALFAFGAALYLATNHFPITEPRRLPLLSMDRAIPFIPESVWIYVSEWLFLPAAYLRCRNLANLNRYFYSYLVLQLAGMAVFIIWPTIYPRELHPLNPAGTGDWTYFAFDNLRRTDTAASCCPSLHVAGLYLSISIYTNGPKRDFLFFLAWGALIAISTLTTKQHYLIDVIAGLGIAALIDWYFRRHGDFRPGSRPHHVLPPSIPPPTASNPPADVPDVKTTSQNHQGLRGWPPTS